ncbi:MAG: hypothetical protein AB9873_12840 [Syntrophobacteraceae bacterium]
MESENDILSDHPANLKDMVQLAKQGMRISAKVDVSISEPCSRVDRLSTGDSDCITATYMLCSNYSVKCDRKEVNFSKTDLLGYFFGTETETHEADRLICRVANERLRGDYRTLKEAEIQLEEAYFEC